MEVGTLDDPVDRDGESAKDGQFEVKKYGSHQYTSHCKAERVWHSFVSSTN